MSRHTPLHDDWRVRLEAQAKHQPNVFPRWFQTPQAPSFPLLHHLPGRDTHQLAL